MWFWRSSAPADSEDNEDTYDTVNVNEDDSVNDTEYNDDSSQPQTPQTQKKKKREPFISQEGLTFDHKKDLCHEENQCSDEHLLNSLLTEQERNALREMKNKNEQLTADYSDRFLIRFLFAKNLDIGEALETLKNFKEWHSVLKLDEFDKKESIGLLRHGLSQWLPGQYSKKGRASIWVRARNMKPELLESLIKYLRSCYYLLDVTLDHDIDIQRKGFIICEDFNGQSFSTLLSMLKYRSQDKESPDMLSCISLVQKSLPIRLRGFYLVDAPWYCKILVSIVRPFLQASLANKINLVTKEQLLEYFDVDMIPTEYGGTFDADWQALLDDVEAHRDDRLGEGRYLSPSIRP